MPTRKEATLDLILTNMHEYCSSPQAYSPFGLSDHNVVVATPMDGKRNINSKKVTMRRDLRTSNKAALGRYLTQINRPLLFTPLVSCEEKWQVFQDVIHSGLDTIMPVKPVKICTADVPWMNESLKSLIMKRQKAFSAYGLDSAHFKYFRNLVNRERKTCRGKYYESKIQPLKGENPKRWWNETKRICGLKTSHSDLASQLNIEGLSELPFKEQANAINSDLLKPLGEYKLPAPLERVPLESDSPEILRVTEQRVQRALEVLNPSKACGPDRTPNWLLKEYCDFVAYPITEILNVSYAEQRLPTIWKMADVTLLPKKKPVVDIKKELRPISLTPCISKVAEEFVVDGFVKPAVMSVLDHNQYGAIPNSSTTMALISVLHSWSLGTDGNGATVRTLLLDYRKAFDLIDHSILVRKLRNQCKLPASIINWIIDFLSDRTQRIKFTLECFSEWGPVPAGVPQGTKLGPWLFVLMINDLDTNAQQWKYVDDTTMSGVVVKGGVSHVQAIANRVIEWSRENRVQLNADKCKELRISFAKEQRAFDPVITEGKEVELVTSTKLLGLTIANDLTWNDHVTEITKKASKGLYFLTQLKRAGVPKQDLAMFYVSCVRSVIDYAAPVFFNGLPQYLRRLESVFS